MSNSITITREDFDKKFDETSHLLMDDAVEKGTPKVGLVFALTFGILQKELGDTLFNKEETTEDDEEKEPEHGVHKVDGHRIDVYAKQISFENILNNVADLMHSLQDDAEFHKRVESNITEMMVDKDGDYLVAAVETIGALIMTGIQHDIEHR